MTSRTCVCTVVTRNFVPFATVWADSIRHSNPDLDVLVCILDGDASDAPSGCSFVSLDELDFPRVGELLFRYGRQQLVVAAKPYVLRAALRRGYDVALFLDADIVVYDSLAGLLEFEDGSVLLTPHLLTPTTGPDAAERELNVILSGVYNGGCVVVRADDSGFRFLEWFADRLWHTCEHAIADGLHYDQTYLDLAPTSFADVAIHRDPGVNVAYWNLPERMPRQVDGAWQVQGAPLRFFHFSGFDPRVPTRPSGYWPSLRPDDMGEAWPLFEQYAELLEAAGATEALEHASFGFDALIDGTPIDGDVRLLVANGMLDVRGLDPRTIGRAELHERAVATRDGLAAGWRGIWELREDLRAAYPDPGGADSASFRGWIDGSASTQHEHLHALIER